MPLYEYQCPRCGRFEQIQKFSDPALSVCPRCGEQVQKLLSAPAFQFKGTGWYVTDYARKGSRGDGTPASSQDGSGNDTAKPSKPGASSTPSNATSKDSAAPGGSSTSK